MRHISLNSHYCLLTRSPRAVDSVRTFFSQTFPGKVPILMKIYDEVMKKNYSHLLIDSFPICIKEARIRSNIFGHVDKNSDPIEIYMLT